MVAFHISLFGQENAREVKTVPSPCGSGGAHGWVSSGSPRNDRTQPGTASRCVPPPPGCVSIRATEKREGRTKDSSRPPGTHPRNSLVRCSSPDAAQAPMASLTHATPVADIRLRDLRACGVSPKTFDSGQSTTRQSLSSRHRPSLQRVQTARPSAAQKRYSVLGAGFMTTSDVVDDVEASAPAKNCIMSLIFS